MVGDHAKWWVVYAKMVEHDSAVVDGMVDNTRVDNSVVDDMIVPKLGLCCISNSQLKLNIS